MTQSIVVALIVVGCALYAAWSLMPAAARRGVARAALKRSLPSPLARRLAPYAQEASGCGCSGCDHAQKPGQVAKGAASSVDVAPITFHRRR